MHPDQDGMAVVARALQAGCTAQEVRVHTLEARRLYISREPWACDWRPLKSFEWGKPTLKQLKPNCEGVVKLSTPGLYFHAYWHCIWGLTKPGEDGLCQWVLLKPEKKGDLLIGLESSYSFPEQISIAGHISLEDMLVEVGSCIHASVVTRERRLETTREMDRSFDAQQAILQELKRQELEQAKQAIEQCGRGEYTGLGAIISLDPAFRRLELNISDDQLAEWRSLAGI